MGRVYNALTRADRWNDSTRPIGSAAGSGAAERSGADRGGEPRQVAREAASSARTGRASDAPFLFHSSAEIDGFISASFQSPPIDGQALNQFTRDQLALEHFVDEWAASQSNAPPAPAPSSGLNVAQAPPPAPIFVEPRQHANVLNLTLDPHLSAIALSDDLASERYRTLAVRLINFASKRKLKTLLVTSAQEGEGKSTVAANLAWVMAKAGARRVLLVDADLRRPSAARMLGVKPNGGWLDMTEGLTKLEDAAIRLDPNSLYLLAPRSASDEAKNGSPGGEASAPDRVAASEALTSSRVEELLQD